MALPLLAAAIAPMSTVDLAYQVRAGGGVLDHGAIPAVDSFTFTVAGQPWFDQQWLAQAILAAVDRLGGWPALGLLRVAIVGAMFGAVFVATRAGLRDARRAAWLTLAAFVVAAPALALRPQLFGMLCFAVVSALLTVPATRRAPWLVLPVVVAWANVHGSFVLAPVLVAAVVAGGIAGDRVPIARAAALVAATAAATCVTPFGPGVWAYATQLAANPEVRALVTEWQPTSVLSVPGLLFYASVVAVAVVVVRTVRAPRPAADDRTRNAADTEAAGRSHWPRPGLPWPTLAWLAVLLAIGVTSARGIAWWALGVPVAIAPLLAPDPRVPGRVERRDRIALALGGVVAVACVAALPPWRPADGASGAGRLLADAPSGIASAVRDAVAGGAQVRVLASQRWASWLELEAPAGAQFVDSRVELFPPAVWDDYGTVVAGSNGWADVLDRWRVDVLALAATEPVVPAVRSASGWRVVHADPDGIVAVRAAP